MNLTQKRISVQRMAELFRAQMGHELPTDAPVTFEDIAGLQPTNTFAEFLDVNQYAVQYFDEETDTLFKGAM